MNEEGRILQMPNMNRSIVERADFESKWHNWHPKRYASQMHLNKRNKLKWNE